MSISFGREPIVFIHDAAIDDFVATLLLQASPLLDLKAVIITNADCVPEPGMDVASRVHRMMGRPDLPVALSEARGWNPFPWPYRTDCIALGKIPSLAPYQSSVVSPPPSGDQLLTNVLEDALKASQPVTILITTGFTPLTQVLEKRPELVKAISRIAWMGGALDVAGNLDPSTIDPSIANTHAEWNVFWDPFAADKALATIPGIADFPLDISDDVPVTTQLLAQLKEQGQKHLFSQFAYEAYDLTSDEPFYRLWNTVAMVWLDAPELYVPPRQTALQIVQWGFEQGWMQAATGQDRPVHSVFQKLTSLPDFYNHIITRLARSAD